MAIKIRRHLHRLAAEPQLKIKSHPLKQWKRVKPLL
jgi:hypothetical protein